MFDPSSVTPNSTNSFSLDTVSSAIKTTFAPLATAVSYMLDPPLLEEPLTSVNTSDKSLISANSNSLRSPSKTLTPL